MIKLLITLFLISFTQLTWAMDKRVRERVYIKKNAVLTSLKDSSLVQVKNGFYADAVEANPSLRDQFYVYDKNGKPLYTVEALDIVEVENDTQLLPGEKGNITYPPKNKFQLINENLPIESEFAIHFDSINLSELHPFINSSLGSTMAPRYALNTHFKTLIPVSVGVNLNYQASSWIDQNNISSDISILSAGPEIKYTFHESEKYKLSVLASYEFCPVYTLKSEGSIDKFSASIFNLGLHNDLDTIIGKLTIGLNYRRHTLTFINSTRTLPDLVSQEYAVNSFGVSVGYNINWDL